MILQEAIDQMQLIMGKRTDLVTDIKAALKRAQDQLERGPTYPWFLVSEDAMIRSSIGEGRIPIPDDFIAEHEDGFLWYLPDDSDTLEPLEKEELDYLKNYYKAQVQGLPISYARVNQYFYLFPIPDDLYQIKMKYYQKDVAISSLANSETNKWLTNAPDTIIGKAGQEVAIGIRDMVAMQKFLTQEQEGRRVMAIQDVEQEMSNRELLMGGPA